MINQDRSAYVRSWADFKFLPGVLEALRRLAATHYAVVVVSNQSAIGRGLVSRVAVEEVHTCMVAVVKDAGGRIDAIYYCPHRPEVGCRCRKPKPGLILQAAGELQLNLSMSWLVGDSVRDLQAGVAAGVRPIMVRTGHGALIDKHVIVQTIGEGVLIFQNLLEAATWLVKQI